VKTELQHISGYKRIRLCQRQRRLMSTLPDIVGLVLHLGQHLLLQLEFLHRGVSVQLYGATSACHVW
jgi:hypothetical protein